MITPNAASYSVWTHDNSSDFLARNAGLSQRRLSPFMSAPDAYSLLTHLAAVYGDGVYADTDLHIRDHHNNVYVAADFHDCHRDDPCQAYPIGFCRWHGFLRTLMQADPVTVTFTVDTREAARALVDSLYDSPDVPDSEITVTSSVTGLMFSRL